jgi:hypothetical protein
MTEVLIETGPRWAWACALDWPGWCRRGKGEDAALEELLAYADRYSLVVPGFKPGTTRVVATVVGPPAMNDWAPSVPGPGEDALPTARHVDALERCWQAFDNAVASSSAELRKGPRGGGRDRDAMVDHVREAERSYGRKIGVRVPPRTPWPEQRAALLEGLRAPDGPWLPRYAVRRMAWHILDHAWEVEDKSLT